jgi:hypothetical protein
MKKVSLLLVAGIISCWIQGVSAQTLKRVIYNESFDSTTISVTSNPANAWRIDTNYSVSPHNSIRGVVPNMLGDSIVLLTPAYDFRGMTFVEMRFQHICKVSPADIVRIDYRISNGRWYTIPASNYTGKLLNYGTQGFSAASYTEWMAGDSLAAPLSSWWKQETFDLSNIVAGDLTEFRFILKRGSTQGTQISYGWLLDDIEFITATYEVILPVVEFVEPLITDTVYNVGPWTVNAKVKTTTTVPIVNPVLVYTATNTEGSVTDSILMTMVAGDSLWSAKIPQYIAGTKIVYSIAGRDATGNEVSITSNYYIQHLCSVIGKTVTAQSRTENTYSYPLPINAVNAYCYTQQIYLASEMQGSGMINSLAFDASNANAEAPQLIDVYIGHTTKSTIPALDSLVPYSDLTMVFSGTFTIMDTGWNVLKLQTPFYYNGIDNIVVAVDKNTGLTKSGRLSNISFYCEEILPNRACSYYSAVADVNPIALRGGTFSSSRNLRPNIEFYFVEEENNCNNTNSAALLSIDNPVKVTMGGTSNPIVVTIQNAGIVDLDSVTVYWTTNGQNLNSFRWKGKLPWNYMTQDTVGYFTGSIGINDTLKVWLSMPNGDIDIVNNDDTLNAVYYGCSQPIFGRYDIGVGKTFTSVDDVFERVKQCGISGDITLALANGLYEETWDLSYLHELLNNYHLTITSASNNPNDVTLRTSANDAIYIYNANNITIENITIDVRKGTRGIYLSEKCTNIVIHNCIILCDTIATTYNSANYYYYSGIFYDTPNSSTDRIENMSITNCTIRGGYYGIFIPGGSSTIYNMNITIDSNILIGQSRSGIEINYTKIKSLSYNQIRSRSVNHATTWHGIRLFFLIQGDNIVGNRIYSTNTRITSTLYGLYAEYIENALIANNEIYLYSAASTNAGLYVYYPQGVDCLHNTVLVTGTSSLTAARLYAAAGTSSISSLTYNATYKNNLFMVKGGGNLYPVYLSTTPGATSTYSIDYNNYYSANTSGVRGSIGYAGGARATLAVWKSIVTMDVNSTDVLPEYKDSLQNLELSNSLEFLCPSSPKVAEDIRMTVRNIVTNMGAYDGFKYNLEAGIERIICNDTTVAYSQMIPVKIKLQNTGVQDNINSATFGWSLNGEIQSSKSWTASSPLAPQQSIEILVDAFTIKRTSNFDISVWIENVNGRKDSIPWNDTAQIFVRASYVGSNLSIQIEPLVAENVLCLDDYLPLKVNVENTGALDYDFTVNPVTFSIRVSQPTSYSFDTVVSIGKINPGELVILELTDKFPIMEGLYDIEVFFNSPADNVQYDDTAQMYYLSGKFNLPVDEYFSSSIPDVFTSNGVNTAHKWEIISQGTDADTVVVPQFGTGMLAFVGSQGSISTFSTKQLDFRNNIQPSLSFWYFHDTVYSEDYTDVRITINEGATYTTLASLTKYNTTYGWKQYNIDLSTYAINQCVLIVFEAMEKSRSGKVVQYIDRIRITARQDIVLTNILPSELTVCELENRDLQIVLSNLSSLDLDYTTTPTTLTLEIKETGEIFTHSLTSGSLENFTSDTITLKDNFNFTKGTYTFKAYFSTVLDIDAKNDTLETSITIAPGMDVRIHSESSVNCLTGEFEIYPVITLYNTGNMDLSDIDLIFQIDTGETGSPVYIKVKEACTQTISVNDTLKYQFTNSYIVPWKAEFYLRVEASLSCDSVLVNATIEIPECVDLNNISVITLLSPVSQTDIVGSQKQIAVSIENKSILKRYTDVTVNALIEDENGQTLGIRMGSIPVLDPSTTEEITLTELYTVPNDSVYYIRVYLNSMDVYPKDDTMKVTRYTESVGIASTGFLNVFTLSQNIPNPANNSTRIDYNVSEAGKVIFHVHSISGQLLYSQSIETEGGAHSIELNTTTFAAGVYFYSMEYKGQRLVKQLIINN